MVDWLVETCMQTKDDIYYGVCTREVMEGRFPDSKRTYTKLKGVELCGADINLTHVRMATEHLDMWETLIGTRKSPLKQAGIIGLGTLFQVLTRTITLENLVEKVCKRIGIKGRAIVWPHAEACMDVDKPHQLELMRADLAKQQRKSAIKAGSRKKVVGEETEPKVRKPVKAKTAAVKKTSQPKPAASKAAQPKPAAKAKPKKP